MRVKLMSMRLVALPSFLLICLACNDVFDARGPIEDKLVVYSILSTDRNLQFVRVGRSYMPNGSDPPVAWSDNALTDASVTITQSGTIYQLRDTMLLAFDSSRSEAPLHSYVLEGLSLEGGKMYTISVTSSHFGTAFGSVVVPRKPVLSLDPLSYSTLNDPTSQSKEQAIAFNVLLSGIAKGYVARLFIEYDVLLRNEWAQERVEVPIGSADPTTYRLDQARYPVLVPRSNNSRIAFLNGYYQAVLSELNWKYRLTRLVFNRVVFQLLQVESNLYDYYSTVHGFGDPQSVRLDEPRFTNIRGGIGLVGSYSLDSLVQILPENFSGNR